LEAINEECSRISQYFQTYKVYVLLLLVQFTGVSKTLTDSIKAMQRELDHPFVTQ